MIIQSLGHIEKLPWVSVAYAVGEVGTNPFWGKAYGRFRPSVLYSASVFIFEVGSAVCGSAHNINILIVGRTIAGLGGSGIYVGTVNILSSLTKISERPLYLSFVGAAWSLGTVLGPIIGGGFADGSATWRWSFYINLCIAAVFAPILLWLLPLRQSSQNDSTVQHRIKTFDFLGLTVFVGGLVSVIMAVDFGGSVYSLSSGQTIGLFITAGVLWILFAIQQSFTIFTTKRDRLFPVHFFKPFLITTLFIDVAIAIASIVIPIYFIPLFFQFVHGYSALSAGVRTLPFIAAVVVAAMINGAIFAKIPVYVAWFAIGGILIAVGGGLLTTTSASISAAKIYGYSVIAGFGAGLVAQAPYTVAQAKIEKDAAAQGTAVIPCGQMAGLALSIGIGTSITVNEATNKIARVLLGFPRIEIQASVAGDGASIVASLDPEVRGEVLEAVARTIGDTFFMLVAGGATMTLLALFMKREPLEMR